MVCFIPRIIVNLFIITTPGGHDDLGTLLVLFKNNSYLMFQAIFALNAVIQSVMALVLYNLLEKHYKACSNFEAACISVITSYLSFTFSCEIANDVVLSCITFLFIWLLTILFECGNKKKRIKLTILLLC